MSEKFPTNLNEKNQKPEDEKKYIKAAIKGASGVATGEAIINALKEKTAETETETPPETPPGTETLEQGVEALRKSRTEQVTKVAESIRTTTPIIEKLRKNSSESISPADSTRLINDFDFVSKEYYDSMNETRERNEIEDIRKDIEIFKEQVDRINEIKAEAEEKLNRQGISVDNVDLTEPENQEKIKVESFEELKNNIEELSDEKVGLALILIIDNLIIKLENGEKIDDKDILEAIKNFKETEAVNEEQEKKPGEQKTEEQEWFDSLEPEEQAKIMNKARIEGKTVDTPEESDDPEINKVNEVEVIEREWKKKRIEAELEKLRNDLKNNKNEHESMSARISALEERLKILEEGVDPETQKTIDELKKIAEELKDQNPAELGKTFKKLFGELENKNNLEEVVKKESKKKAGGCSSLLFLLFAAIVTNTLKHLFKKAANPKPNPNK